jgi:hypothetical protein
MIACEQAEVILVIPDGYMTFCVRLRACGRNKEQKKPE